MAYRIKEGDRECIIHIGNNVLDLETMKQIRKMIIHPAIEHPRVMPDCHKGMGCCVGFTSIITDKIVPNFIGGDIGCGMITYSVKNLLPHKSSVQKVERTIKEVIPMGNGHENVYESPLVGETSETLKMFLDSCNNDIILFVKKYKEKFGVDITQNAPNVTLEYMKELCQKVGTNFEYDLRNIGTLGGGNHFIEINEDPNENLHYITIHTGSRNIGMAICEYHQKKISDHDKMDYDEYNDKLKRAEKSIKDVKQLKKIRDQVKEEMQTNLHTPYLEGDEAYEYYFDMIFAQNYSKLNRKAILRNILQHLDIEYDENNVIESVHNYIDFDDFVMRKGAIRAHNDQPCIIALNMRDGILICKGKGNQDWNYSSAHGAGRLIPRQKAFQKITMKSYLKQMQGVYSTCISEKTIDECPNVYKDSESIKEALNDSVEVIKHAKCVINLKGV